MRKTNIFIASLTAAVLCFPTVNHAQTLSPQDHLTTKAQTDPDLGAFLHRLDQQVSNGDRNRIVARMLQEFYLIAPDGALSQDDLNNKMQQDKAEQRASVLRNYFRFDLDGDAQVSRAEIAAFAGPIRAEAEALFLTVDGDGDDLLTTSELFASADANIRDNHRSTTSSHYMVFDFDADGITTTQELLLAIDTLSEFDLAIERQPRRILQPDVATCAAPTPAQTDQVVVLSGYEGGTLSTVAVSGLNNETEVATLTIEPGEKPIYLFVTAHIPMIWEISGETDRLSAVVVQRRPAQDGPGAGVTGVSKDIVHFIDASSCIDNVHDIDGGKGLLAYRQISQNLKREPDNMLAYYTIGQISLPSGEGQTERGEGTDTIVYGDKQYELTPEGPRLLDGPQGQLPGDAPYGTAFVLRSFERFHPNGIRQIALEDVVSPSPAIIYDVYPQEAGLLQLLLEEKLRYTRDGYFIIQKPIPRFPAGLAGAHSVKFILAEGVPMPGGSPSHSSVASAETGECLTRMCR